MKLTTYKCDRCGTIPENGMREGWSVLRLTMPDKVFVADLCPACSSQIKGDPTFTMQARKGGKRE